MDFSQITIYDFFVFGIIFIWIIIILLLGLYARGWLRILLCSFTFLLFLAAPFLNIIIMDNYINKVELVLNSAKKLVYIDTFFIDGKITNKGKKIINNCILYMYINKIFPFQKPEYIVLLNDVDLKVDSTFEFNKMIKDFKHDDEYKKIKIRCF